MSFTVCTVVGARPQFVKAAVVSRALVANEIPETIIHTGQHYDANMSDVFFSELEIPEPDYNLGIGGGTHGSNTGRMIEAIETLLIENRPDIVLVYGDTDSTLAATLAAVKLHIPVAHVEAGLRSFNRRMPEEVNRVLTDHAADVLFAPTKTAVDHLINEGVPAGRIDQVGDVMYDAALFYGDMARQRSAILDQLSLTPKAYVLGTIHRAENTDDADRLRAIIEGFALSGRSVVLPLHPRTRSRLASFALSLPDNVLDIDPVGYLDMVMLEKNASLIVTDSGGVQKEAFFHGIPCVTVRDETEWVELVETGWNRLAPPRSARDVASVINRSKPLSQETDSFYGDGHAGEHIVDRLKQREIK